MRKEKPDNRKYARDKPSDCAYCYFWSINKKCCGQKECYYLLTDTDSESAVPKTEDTMPEEAGNCETCVYGKNSPCIGYCIKKILLEMRQKKQTG